MSNTYNVRQWAMAIMHALNCYGYNLIDYRELKPVEYSKHILHRLEYIDSIRDNNMVYTSVTFKRTKGRGIVKDIRVRVCGHAHGSQIVIRTCQFLSHLLLQRAKIEIGHSSAGGNAA